MVSKWVITPIYPIYRVGYNPLILTIDPNFVGHPSNDGAFLRYFQALDAMRSLFVTACGQMTSELCKLSAPQGTAAYCTPPKFNMEPQNDRLEDGFSFSRMVFSGSMLNFRGVGEAMAFPRKPGKKVEKGWRKWGRYVLKLAPWYCISKYLFCCF